MADGSRGEGEGPARAAGVQRIQAGQVSVVPIPANDEDQGPAKARTLAHVSAALALAGLAWLAWYLFML